MTAPGADTVEQLPGNTPTVEPIGGACITTVVVLCDDAAAATAAVVATPTAAPTAKAPQLGSS